MKLARLVAVTASLAFGIAVLPPPAEAAWFVTVGKVVGVYTYASTDTVFVTLNNQPSGPLPPGCTSTVYFAINGALPAERRQAMMAQVLSAQASNADVHISWDEAGSCVTAASVTVPSIQRLIIVK